MRRFVLAFLICVVEAFRGIPQQRGSSRSTSSPTTYLPSSSSSSSSALSSTVQKLLSLTPDGGVVKEIITRGSGKSIEAGDILAVEYVACVKGTSTCFARGDKERFVYKDGSLIKGWDIGVGSMQVGEKARIVCSASYAYGSKGVVPVVPPDAAVEVDIRVLAWLGNQMRPESLFQKDLDIDPFIASTPETIQAEYEDMQMKSKDKYEGGILALYWNRLTNISFGFGGSGFFQSQSGEKAPWYLNPNITFPAMISIVLAAFITVLSTGSVKEKGERSIDPDLASTFKFTKETKNNFFG